MQHNSKYNIYALHIQTTYKI